jgi:hypothetical protein
MKEAKTLITAISCLTASISMFTLGAMLPKDRLPSGFVWIDPKIKQKVFNLSQILVVTTTWDPKISITKRTKKNANWTFIKMTDNSTLTIQEDMESFLSRARNNQ